jgi:hypothetical protein
LSKKRRAQSSLPVAPELAEGLLEHIGGVEALIGGQQNLEGALTLQVEIFMARQQIVRLALDEASILAFIKVARRSCRLANWGMSAPSRRRAP